MLFKTAEELQQYLPQNASFEFEALEPYIRLQGEPQFIEPVLGTDLYNELTAAYNTNEFTDALTALLDKVRFPLAYYSYCKYIPASQVKISAAGIHIEVNDQRKTAFEWQVEKLEASFNEGAYNGLEALYEFMETNKDDYPTWTGSANYSILKECFINTAKEFSSIFNINNSRRTFIAAKPIMKRIEEWKVKPILGATLYDAIKAEIISGSIGEANALLLSYIKPAVANLTMDRLLTEIPVRITADGVQLLGTSPRASFALLTPAETQRIDTLKREVNSDGEAYLGQLTAYLYAHVGDYPDWVAGGNYIDPAVRTDWDQSTSGVVSF